VVPKLYGLLSGRDDVGYIGGAEVQQAMIASELTRRGYTVSVITYDHGQPDAIVHQGIRVLKMCRPEGGIRGIRFVHPRWTSLWAAMRRAQADVYLQRSAGSETGQMVMWCRRHARRSIFTAASDSDCDPRLPYLKTGRERLLYRYATRNATRVIAQTESQVRSFRAAFGVDAVLVRSCSDDPLNGSPEPPSPPLPTRPRLLWVGRFAMEKRPEMLLELAEACPECDYDIVGATNAANEYADGVTRRAAQLSNAALHGRVPHGKMGDYYSRATFLVCTSKWEGYPNTFMEAWARGIPVISTVDPDGVISSNGLGRLGESVADLKDAIRGLLASGDQRRECGRRARRFFLDNDTIEATVDAYETILARACV